MADHIGTQGADDEIGQLDGTERMAEIVSGEIQSRAQSALQASPIYLLRMLQVEQVEDSLYLSGRVDSFYHKQLAQEVVRAVSGELEVVNTVAVDGD